MHLINAYPIFTEQTHDGTLLRNDGVEATNQCTINNAINFPSTSDRRRWRIIIRSTYFSRNEEIDAVLVQLHNQAGNVT